MPDLGDKAASEMKSLVTGRTIYRHGSEAAHHVLEVPMQELLVGDPAPDTELTEFLKGAPLSALELGKAYVLVFWATWCGPCRANVPHHSDLQDKYPQAAFIGVAVMEPNTEAISAFVEKMDNQIRYRIAVEAPLPGRSSREGGLMTKHWLEASCQMAANDEILEKLLFSGI